MVSDMAVPTARSTPRSAAPGELPHDPRRRAAGATERRPGVFELYRRTSRPRQSPSSVTPPNRCRVRSPTWPAPSDASSRASERQEIPAARAPRQGRLRFGVAMRRRQGGGACLKLTRDQASWHREAYMAELLRGDPRVVRVVETFPVVGKGPVSYAVVMELAEHGTLADVVKKRGAWTESRAVAEIVKLLGTVGRLHGSGALQSTTIAVAPSCSASRSRRPGAVATRPTCRTIGSRASFMVTRIATAAFTAAAARWPAIAPCGPARRRERPPR